MVENQHIFDSLSRLLSKESATSSISAKMMNEKLALYSHAPLEKNLLINILTKKIEVANLVNSEHHSKRLKNLVNKIRNSSHHYFRKSTLSFQRESVVVYSNIEITEFIGMHKSRTETYNTIIEKIKIYEIHGIPYNIILYENGLER